MSDNGLRKGARGEGPLHGGGEGNLQMVLLKRTPRRFWLFGMRDWKDGGREEGQGRARRGIGLKLKIVPLLDLRLVGH